MSLEKILSDIELKFDNENIKPEQALLVFANYLINRKDYFLQLDKSMYHIPVHENVDFTDSSIIDSMVDVFPESFTYNLSSIAHQLIYFNNKITSGVVNDN